MRALLIHLQPMTAAGARVDVRVASVPAPHLAGLGGFVWEGAVSRRPRIMLDLMSPKLDGKINVGRADFMLNLNEVKSIADPWNLEWSGAPVVIYDAHAGDYTAMPVEFRGIVATQQLDIWTKQLIVNGVVEKSKLERPLLTLDWTGGGGVNGDPAMKGVLKPAGFGFVQNVEPVWFDETNNVGMLDGYGNLTSVPALYEGGSEHFGGSVGNYASYAALIAASIPPGFWATCIAEGLVRLGAPPAGRISCDPTFRGAAGTNANMTGGIIRRILETHGGIATGDLDTASFASLDAAVPRTIHYWTREQREILNLIEAMSAAVNASTLILLDGKIAVTRAFGGANVGTVSRTGTSIPPVTDWQIANPEEPLWRMRARSVRPGSVFDYNDIFYEDDLLDLGAWDVGDTYRQGHLVWMPDGSQWLYTYADPTSGNSPPTDGSTSNTWWTRTRPPTTAADLDYADGTPIENLKPAIAGAAPPFVPVSIGSQSVTIRGNTFKRDAGDADYNAAVRGESIAKGIWAETEIITTAGAWTMVALDNDATTTTLAGQLIIAQYQYSSGTLNVYRNNVSELSTNIGQVTGMLAVSYDNRVSRAYAGGVQRGPDWTETADLTLWPKWHAYTTAIQYRGLAYWAHGAEHVSVAPGASADTPLALVSTVTAAMLRVIGNTIRNISTDGSFQRCVVSQALANTASARMQIATGAFYTVLALDDLATGYDYSAQTIYLQYRQSDGSCAAYRNGVSVTLDTSPGSGKVGDLEVRYDGVDYTLWVADTKVATIRGVGAQLTHYAKFWAYNSGYTYSGIRAGYYSDNNFTNIGGTNRPENNATHSEAVMQDDFGYASAAAYEAMWEAAAGGSATSLGGFNILTDTAVTGNQYNRLGDNTGNDFARHRWRGDPFAVDPGVLYEIEIIWKQLNGAGVAKVGFEGLNTDKATIVGTDGTASSALSHWVAMAGTAPAGAFTSYKGYIKGKGAAGSSTVKADPAAPGVFHNNVAYARPIIEFNGPSNAGTVDIDKIVVRRVTQLAEINADIASEIVGQTEITVFADYLGVPKPGELSKVLGYKLFKAGVQVTAGITWSAVLNTGNATFTTAGAGTCTFTITGPNNATLADESTVRLTATPATGAARNFDILIRKQNDPPPTGGTGGSGNPGTTQSTSSFSSITSTSHATISSTLTVKAGTNGQVRCTLPASFRRTPGTATGLTGMYGKIQWRVVGGTFADIAAETADSGDAETEVNAGDPPMNSAGSINIDVTKTGLTSGTDYEFRLQARKDDVSGDVDNIYISTGTLTVAGS